MEKVLKLTCRKDLITDVLRYHAFMVLNPLVIILVLPAEDGRPVKTVKSTFVKGRKRR
jgi:hypothetical protein